MAGRRNCDIVGSKHTIDLGVSTYETTGLNLTLPTEKPGTPQWSYTVQESDMHPYMDRFYQGVTYIACAFSTGSEAVASLQTTAYIEVYRTRDTVTTLQEDDDGTVNVGEFTECWFEVEVEPGDIIDVYLWASNANELIIDERFYAFGLAKMWPVREKQIIVDRADNDEIPQMLGRIGSGTPGNLQHRHMQEYNKGASIDSTGGNFILERDSDGHGIEQMRYTLPNVTIDGRTQDRWPDTNNNIRWLEYKRIRI